MEKKKILFITHYYSHGGFIRILIWLANYLDSTKKYDVFFCSVSNEIKQFYPLNVGVTKIDGTLKRTSNFFDISIIASGNDSSHGRNVDICDCSDCISMDFGMIPYKRNLFRDGVLHTFANIVFYESQVFGVIFESKSGDNIQSLFEKRNGLSLL